MPATCCRSPRMPSGRRRQRAGRSGSAPGRGGGAGAAAPRALARGWLRPGSWRSGDGERVRLRPDPRPTGSGRGSATSTACRAGIPGSPTARSRAACPPTRSAACATSACRTATGSASGCSACPTTTCSAPTRSWNRRCAFERRDAAADPGLGRQSDLHRVDRGVRLRPRRSRTSLVRGIAENVFQTGFEVAEAAFRQAGADDRGGRKGAPCSTTSPDRVWALLRDFDGIFARWHPAISRRA